MSIDDPKALLKRLLRETEESTWLEFKRNNSEPEMVGSYISACANAAILEGKERAFIVFGVEDVTRAPVGTSVRLKEQKKGGENLENWVNRLVEPRMMIEFIDFQMDGRSFSIISMEPTYDRPVRFSGIEFIRIG